MLPRSQGSQGEGRDEKADSMFRRLIYDFMIYIKNYTKRIEERISAEGWLGIEKE